MGAEVSVFEVIIRDCRTTANRIIEVRRSPRSPSLLASTRFQKGVRPEETYFDAPQEGKYSVDTHVVHHGSEYQEPRSRTAREALANLTGETKPEAITRALRDRLDRLRRERSRRRLADELDEIARHCAQLPVRDSGTPDEILGYDETGLPH